MAKWRIGRIALTLTAVGALTWWSRGESPQTYSEPVPKPNSARSQFVGQGFQVADQGFQVAGQSSQFAGLSSQSARQGSRSAETRPNASEQNSLDPQLDEHDSFTFVRVKYDSTGGFGESWYTHEGRNWERWETDYPRAEQNLILRLNELTSLRVNPEPIVLRLTDRRIFDHPFLFMSDVGWQFLRDEEKEALTRYLEAGGFLWADDFWGISEWNNFQRNVGQLKPDWKWRPIPSDHSILNIVYPLKECPQIPARIFFAQSGLEFDPPGVHRYPSGGYDGVREVHFMGLFDRNERLLAVATHNTDIADGWEREGESREFFDRFSIRSYAISINILFYALTH